MSKVYVYVKYLDVLISFGPLWTLNLCLASQYDKKHSAVFAYTNIVNVGLRNLVTSKNNELFTVKYLCPNW